MKHWKKLCTLAALTGLTPATGYFVRVSSRDAGGAVLGIAGDGLDASGGVEGAYLSGVALAARLTRADDAVRT